jgi:chorismate mutase/prephenate dehydratase
MTESRLANKETAMNDKLKPLREQIDAIDAQILDLLNRRAKVAQEVGHVKAETNAPVFRPEREAQVLRGVADRNPGPMGNTEMQTIFREIMSACRSLEKRVTVAFLGPAGTYSEQAVYQQFGTAVDVLACASIDEVFRASEAGTADFGVVPIENSTEGAIGRTLDLLLNTPLTISGEVAIAVRHSLLTASGNMDGVTAICAHAQALAQCQIWLNNNYPDIERRAVSSNAEAARMARDDHTVAAIAGERAGVRYSLGTVKANIQDDPHNRTRFAVIGTLRTGPSGIDRTSMALAAPHKAGSVYRLLGSLAQNGVSMTRFESRPARNGNWEYYFYVDVEGHIENPAVAKALEELQANAAFFKVLGSYPVSLT